MIVANRWPNLLKPPTETGALFLTMNRAVGLPLLTNMSGKEDWRAPKPKSGDFLEETFKMI